MKYFWAKSKEFDDIIIIGIKGKDYYFLGSDEEADKEFIDKYYDIIREVD